jgi:hypothetical protein
MKRFKRWGSANDMIPWELGNRGQKVRIGRREKLRGRGVLIAATSRKNTIKILDVSTVFLVSVRMTSQGVEIFVCCAFEGRKSPKPHTQKRRDGTREFVFEFTVRATSPGCVTGGYLFDRISQSFCGPLKPFSSHLACSTYVRVR